MNCLAPRTLRGGFTLVEVMVALAIMALISLLAWRGVDSMARAQEQTSAYTADVQALQTGLSQWGADLDAMTQTPPVGGLDFDGRVIRMARYYPFDSARSAPSGEEAATATGGGSVRVVAWGLRAVDGKRLWLRWQSGPLRTRAEMELAWQQAGTWGQNPTADLMRREVAIAAIDDWQIFYYRNNSWTSPMSSAFGAGASATNGLAPFPDGIRMVLMLSEGQAVSGRLTRDWVRATLGGGRS